MIYCKLKLVPAGTLRERLVITFFRAKGSSDIPNIEQVCAGRECLCAHARARGWRPSHPHVQTISDAAESPQVVRLCRCTGYNRAEPARRPRGYPEEYFARFNFPEQVRTRRP